jgi:hypothetical protein
MGSHERRSRRPEPDCQPLATPLHDGTLKAAFHPSVSGSDFSSVTVLEMSLFILEIEALT